MDPDEEKRITERAAISDLKNQIREWTKDRDSSHGYEHMKEVAEIALQLYDEEKENPNQSRELPDRFIVEVAAWIHDVADHKYDPNRDLRRKLVQYLNIEPLTNLSVAEIMWIINNVSYSREIQLEGSNLAKHADDFIGYARDLISDADKSLALGKIGYQRCRAYTMSKLGFDEDDDLDNLDQAKIVELIRIHARDKLLRLYPEGFFRTESGKKRAKKLHDELVKILEDEEIIIN